MNPHPYALQIYCLQQTFNELLCSPRSHWPTTFVLFNFFQTRVCRRCWFIVVYVRVWNCSCYSSLCPAFFVSAQAIANLPRFARGWKNNCNYTQTHTHTHRYELESTVMRTTTKKNPADTHSAQLISVENIFNMCSTTNNDLPRTFFPSALSFCSVYSIAFVVMANGFIARQSFCYIHCLYLCHKLDGKSSQRKTEMEGGWQFREIFAI